MNHTPGPWTIAPVRDGTDISRLVSAENYGIAQVYVHRGRTRANTLLIASAPDLLAALRQLHDNIAEYARINNLGGFDNQDMRMARAAIAKAYRE